MSSKNKNFFLIWKQPGGPAYTIKGRSKRTEGLEIFYLEILLFNGCFDDFDTNAGSKNWVPGAIPGFNSFPWKRIFCIS